MFETVSKWTTTALLLGASAAAQLPARLEKCLPIPSYGSELEAYENAVATRSSRPTAGPTVRVDLKMDASLLPAWARRELRNQIERSDFDLEEWKTRVAERVRFQFQRQGYFKVEVEMTEDPQRPTADNLVKGRRIRVTAIVHPGPQFRLGGIEFKGQTAFSEAELRPLFPIRDAEIFDTDKIRLGLENLRKAYATKGFINFTPIPDTVVDEEKATIRLQVDLDEGSVYHVGEIKALGVDESVVKRILEAADANPGAVFNAAKLETAIFRLHKQLPRGWDFGESRTTRDDKNHTVSMVLDFRRCPGK